jgi:hypothetical protein
VLLPDRNRSQIYNLTGRWALGPVVLTGTGSVQHRPTNPCRVRIGDQALASLRVGVENSDRGWSAHVFVDNLFNSIAINRATKSAFINSYGVTSATPRTVGLNLRWRS